MDLRAAEISAILKEQIANTLAAGGERAAAIRGVLDMAAELFRRASDAHHAPSRREGAENLREPCG